MRREKREQAKDLQLLGARAGGCSASHAVEREEEGGGAGGRGRWPASVPWSQKGAKLPRYKKGDASR